MNKHGWIVFGFLTLLAAAEAGAALAEPGDLTGRWRTAEGATVEIDACGASICGHIVDSPEIAANPDLVDARNKDPAQRGRRLKNLVILSGFRREGAAWVGGRAYDPHNGGTYAASLRLADPGTLKLTGCIALGLCETQAWTRAR